MKPKSTYRQILTYALVALAAIGLAVYSQSGTSVTRTHVHIGKKVITHEPMPSDYYGVIYKGPLLVPLISVIVLLGIGGYLIWKSRRNK